MTLIEWKRTFRVYTPFGAGLVKALRIEGDEADMLWTVLHEDGVIVEVPNHKVRGQTNWTQGRISARPPQEPLQNLTGLASVE